MALQDVSRYRLQTDNRLLEDITSGNWMHFYNSSRAVKLFKLEFRELLGLWHEDSSGTDEEDRQPL
jgi:hypothetical protein